uniref:G-protein coupled receptors family 1 profile domain-containing protein n=1 Tax=Cyprinus carpio TaxID=7962 RepID=A0A8C1RG56_CYPCA
MIIYHICPSRLSLSGCVMRASLMVVCLDTGPSGRSFFVQRVYETQTDEPFDYNMDETSPDSSLMPNKTHEEIRQQASQSNKRAHPCINTDLNAAKCNRTKVLVFNISDEAADFLKGPMATRIMPSFYIIIFLISLPLNALALVTFTCKIREKKPAVIYMSHLACVDLLFTLLLPLKIHYQLNASDWVFGEAACRVITAAYYCYMYCSILLMMCISVDRLLAVVFPIASLTWRKARKATFICTLVWLLALAGTVPLLSMRQTFKIKNVGVTCHDALIHDDPKNALALVTFTCKIREKKPAVIYMSHLACVDLLFTLLLPLKIHYQLNASDWVFGEAACRVITAAYYCYMYCSILLMMCISVDRLLAVVFPIASLTWRKARKATFICTLVWLLALAGTVPLLSMRQTFKIKNVGVTCHDALIHDDPKDQLYMYLFFILSCLYYFVPLIVTLVSYSTIIYALRTKSNQLAKSSSLSEKRRRAVIMAFTVLMVFVICFAPTNGILLYHCVQLATTKINSREGDSSYAAYLVAVCLGSVSVFLDPLLYYYGSSQMRQKINSVFWWRWGKTTLSNSNTQTESSHVSVIKRKC